MRMWRIIIISAWASGVVCSAIIGNARASVRGIDNGVVPRFLFVLSLVFKLETKGTDMKMEDNINSRIAFPPVSEENRVIERPYLISGYGGGKYYVAIYLLKGKPWNWEVNDGTELKFSGYYCCK